MIGLGGLDARNLGLVEGADFETVGRGFERAIQEVDLDLGVERHQIDQVERAAVELRPGRRGAVGDALHLFKVFRIILTQEKRTDEGAHLAPRGRGVVAASLDRQGVHVVGDLGRQEPAVLIPTLVGSPFNVEHDPARLGIPVRRPESFNCRGVGPGRLAQILGRLHRPRPIRR